MGREEDLDRRAPAPSALGITGALHGLRDPEAPRPGAEAQEQAPYRPSRQAHQFDPRTERGLVRRLQGPVQDRRWHLLLPAHRDRWLQPLSARLPGLLSTAVSGAKPVFTRLFKEYGLPRRIRTDNGVPFATNTLARLSSLSAWWIRLGVLPDLIEPGKPQQNGRHERMHRTLKAEATKPPAGNLQAQQRKFNRFREEFNHERPHEALDQQTPASCYQPSPREMPNKLPPLEYPDRFEVRYVSTNGGIRWNSDWVNVSIVCAGEYVGLEEIDDGIWNVYFGPLKLGRLHERHMRIEDEYGRLKRHKV
jgi:hypothetical protein